MPNGEAELLEIFLQPGEMFLARQPTILRTLLGSCVGVTFGCRRLGLGALCHAILPRCPHGFARNVSPEVGYRYVDFSIRDMARRFDELGAPRDEVQVKLFGGADVLICGNETSARATVGRLNCETALEVLRCEGFQIAASSLRGESGLDIYFNTGNGEIRLRRLKHNAGFAARWNETEGLGI
jgi:chemotaxis protein CheD